MINRTVTPIRVPIPKNSKNRGVTLLEVMIVLVILAGALAIVWPSLHRQLNRIRLDEASQTIREAIDESRHKAVSRNQSMLIRLRKGDQDVLTGSFEAFAEDLGNREVLTSSSHASEGKEQSSVHANDSGRVEPQVWRLPDDVVVVNVESGAASPSTTGSFLEESSLGTDRNTAESSDSSFDSNSSLSQDNSKKRDNTNTSNAGDDLQEWWVPLDAQGSGFDAKITLLDKVTNKSIHVTYSAATGQLEISR